MRLTDVEPLWAIMLPGEWAERALTGEYLDMGYPTVHRGLLLVVAEDPTRSPYGEALGLVEVAGCAPSRLIWEWHLRHAVRLREPWGMIGRTHMWRLEDLCAEKIWGLVGQ